MYIFCFIFPKICTINEEFDFYESRGGGEGGGKEPPGGNGSPNNKILSQLLLVNI